MTKFEERSLGGLDSRSRPHPSIVPMPKDHQGWVAYWSDECLFSIRSYEETGLDVAMQHAVRSARMVWYHVCRLKNYRYWEGKPQ